jgi:hypothetical protein
MTSDTNKKRIEVTEETGIKFGRTSLAFEDVVSIDTELANTFISYGWAKCVGTGEQGERKPGAVKIEVESVVQKLASL